MQYTYDYPRPMVTTDCIVLHGESENFKVLLIKRKNNPYKNLWALPGGFVDMNEDLEAAALRELQEETGIIPANIKQLFTVGTPGRDPRGRTISVIYYTIFKSDMPTIIAGDDASEARWFSVNNLPGLAFDHTVVLQNGIEKILATIK